MVPVRVQAFPIPPNLLVVGHRGEPKSIRGLEASWKQQTAAEWQQVTM
jgi:hypothetical protein